MAAPMVTANSWNSRPMIPPMNSTGMNTAASDSVMERMVNPTSRAPAHAGRHRDRVRARLPLDRQHDRPVAVEPGGALVVLHVVEHEAEVLQAHRGPVAEGHDQRPELLGVLQSPVRQYGVRPVRSPQNSGRE